ncbi:hypothetical protein JDV02_007800 [Purpureocillium takamizusanense]|uniref:Uncharacterized protein n=1 Tax=Purpureocillium takamizusanense TaxID=2060973 RepID=A0A9Q8QLC2_9HYPO|nr:uncharacterized protein JDV02_007800 [Purpureocillium takamizusanense]UNI21848.1 hypothetical protein JDV02_007800 [Purpureocillium takamizusanense]
MDRLVNAGNILVGVSASVLVYGVLVLHALPSRRGAFVATDEWIRRAVRRTDASHWDRLAMAEMCC